MDLGSLTTDMRKVREAMGAIYQGQRRCPCMLEALNVAKLEEHPVADACKERLRKSVNVLKRINQTSKKITTATLERGLVSRNGDARGSKVHPMASTKTRCRH